MYDPDDRLGALDDALADCGFRIDRTRTAEGVETAVTGDVDCLVLGDYDGSDWKGVLDSVSDSGVATVVYTGREGSRSIQRPLAAGVDDVVRVPPRYGSLLRRRIEAATTEGSTFDSDGEQFRSLLRSYPHTLFVKDTDSRFANITTQTAGDYGYDRASLIGKTDFEILPAELAAENYEEEQAIIGGDRPLLDKVEHYVDDDGNDQWVSTTKVPRYDDDGNVVGIVGGTQYITPAKKQEQLLADLHEASQRLARAKTKADVATTAVEIAAETEPFAHAEVALDTGSGLAPTATSGDISQLFADHRETFEAVFATGVADDVDGTSCRVVPIGEYGVLGYHQSGTPASEAFVDRMVSVFTANVEAALDRAERERQLTETTRRIEEFATLGSHELRNKLQVVVGNVTDAHEEYDDPRLERSVATLDRIDRLLEQLLQLARTGSVPHQREWVDVENAATAAWRTIDNRGTTLSVDSTVTVDANRSALVGMFEFLLENVVDHAGDEAVATVGSLPDRPGFYVEDDGRGIPSDPDLFEAAYTTGDSDTGYGLYVTQAVVDAHDWDIDVTESGDGGARFEITSVDERAEY
nr:ATP-binding protein [Halapricum sp. CBA1109]